MDEKLQKQMEEKIQKQVRETYYKAFYDSIDDTINSDKPDYDWIERLYSEIKDRLFRYIKKDSQTYRAIDESFDIELFNQMIRNDVFDHESMVKMINNTFSWIKKLQAPVRDKETDESLKIVFESEPKNIVSVYLREVYKCLNNLDEDMYNFYKK
jgi:Mg2+ and Co2+ transporter CorA